MFGTGRGTDCGCSKCITPVDVVGSGPWEMEGKEGEGGREGGRREGEGGQAIVNNMPSANNQGMTMVAFIHLYT